MILRRLDTYFSKARKILELIFLSKEGFQETGKRSVFWLGVGIVSILALVFIEAAFISQIQKILRLLNLGTQELRLAPVSPELSRESPLIALSLLFGITLVRGVCTFFTSFSPQMVDKLFMTRMRKKLFFHFLSEKDRPGALSAAEVSHFLGDLLPRASSFMSRQTQVIATLVFVAATSIYMFYIAAVKMLIAMTGFLFIFFALNFFHRKNRQAATVQLQYNNYIFKHLDRIVTNFFMIRSLRTADVEYRQLVGLSIFQSSNLIRSMLWTMLTGNLAVTLGGVLLCLLIGLEALSPLKTGESFLIFLYMLIRLVQKIGELASLLGFMNAEYPNFYATVTFFKNTDAERETSQHYMRYIRVLGEARRPRRVQVFRHFDPELVERMHAPTVEFKNVNFGYSKDQKIFENLDLKIGSGEFLGLVGKSGSGKSTLLSLLLGLLKPEQGSIEIGGVDARVFYQSVPLPMAYSGPDPFVFPGTLREILDYGRWREYSQEDYETAMQMAKFMPVYRALGADLNWEYSEQDSALSTGEKQRLSLARAFLLKPKILILDEVTANLDAGTESDILQSLESLKGRCTIIMISHRASSLVHADRIFDVSAKRFLEAEDLSPS
jgi:ABC-type multidrug transport system fused ATPase/permease subunit